VVFGGLQGHVLHLRTSSPASWQLGTPIKTFLFLKTVRPPAPLLLSLHVVSSLVFSQSFPHSCIFMRSTRPGTGCISESGLVRVEGGRESCGPSADDVQQRSVLCKPGAHGSCLCCLFPCIVAASALVALDSSTKITPVTKQDTLETLVTCCLLCVSAGLLQTQLRGTFVMPVCVCISRRGKCSSMCSVLPARQLEGILHSKVLESKDSVYSVPKAQVIFPVLKELHACLQHLTYDLVVVLRVVQ